MIRSRSTCALAAGLMIFLAAAHGEISSPAPEAARSASGQFIVSVTPNNSPFFRRPEVSTNTEILRLAAPWLVVSAEHFKSALGRELELPASSPWRGKVFITLHTARSLNEPVFITSQPFIHVWNYRLELPDLVSRNRYARAFGAVLLLEIANRNAPVTGRSAEIPAWLADGLARQITEADDTGIILSSPTKSVDSVAVTRSGPAQMPDGMRLTRMNLDHRGRDALASARQVLQNFPALTFDQLSWPNDAQLNGGDDGVYLASAQLFVHELLGLKNGPAKTRSLLAQLPACQNWQSAFFAAFQEYFRSPLDVEKWWALRVVAFAARAPGPQWTVPVSRGKLDAILSVPVEVRSASNALPTRAEITLQAAIQSFQPPRQTAILRTKLRDLDLVQLRLTPALAAVADGYRTALADFLGERKKKTIFNFWIKRGPARPGKADTAAMVKRLDELDTYRREIEARLDRQTLHLPGQ